MDWPTDFARWLDPAWVTACVAVVVGGYTVLNVRTARRAYIESTEDRKVAQARLVWATVGVHLGKRKGQRPGDMGQKVLGTSGRLVGDARDDYEPVFIDGEHTSVITRGLTIHVVRVTNNSAEPIGRLRLTLAGSKPHRIVNGETVRPPKPRRWEHGTGVVASVIKPGETMDFRVVVPVSIEETDIRDRKVTISFSDSAGHRWTRTDTSPPVPFPQHKPPRFQKFRAWKFRTKHKVKGWLSRKA